MGGALCLKWVVKKEIDRQITWTHRHLSHKVKKSMNTKTQRRAWTLTTDEYITLTRATDNVVFPLSMKGITNIGAQAVPALLVSVTNGAFKFYWSSFILSRDHITFERLDDDGRFAEMRTMLAADDERARFLRWHMTNTADVWKWRFSPPEPSIPCDEPSQ